MKDTDAGRRIREYVKAHPGPVMPAQVIDETGVKPTTVHSTLRRLADMEPGLLTRAEGGRYAGWVSLAEPAAVAANGYPVLTMGDGLTIMGEAVDGVYPATDDATGHLWAVVPAQITLRPEVAR